MDALVKPAFKSTIEEIDRLDWDSLDRKALTRIAWAYYYFSIQFRENLEAATWLYPDDEKLAHLKSEECDTANLSPWPGVAKPGERMNHDEFMRRLLDLDALDADARRALQGLGEAYLMDVRPYDIAAKAMSIASYEDGGLETVFRAILRARAWNSPLLQAFRHFLTEHIRFDSDPDQGHGALSRHIEPDDRILPFWRKFHQLLVAAAPQLAG
ncbi:MAG TPA: hypothetical protein VFN42_03040 [Acetobacteraceae bacterium]|nr:hypothetical protein [Acetobacteraceae bacterium]